MATSASSAAPGTVSYQFHPDSQLMRPDVSNQEQQFTFTLIGSSKFQHHTVQYQPTKTLSVSGMEYGHNVVPKTFVRTASFNYEPLGEAIRAIALTGKSLSGSVLMTLVDQNFFSTAYHDINYILKGTPSEYAVQDQDRTIDFTAEDREGNRKSRYSSIAQSFADLPDNLKGLASRAAQFANVHLTDDSMICVVPPNYAGEDSENLWVLEKSSQAAGEPSATQQSSLHTLISDSNRNNLKPVAAAMIRDRSFVHLSPQEILFYQINHRQTPCAANRSFQDPRELTADKSFPRNTLNLSVTMEDFEEATQTQTIVFLTEQIKDLSDHETPLMSVSTHEKTARLTAHLGANAFAVSADSSLVITAVKVAQTPLVVLPIIARSRVVLEPSFWRKPLSQNHDDDTVREADVLDLKLTLKNQQLLTAEYPIAYSEPTEDLRASDYYDTSYQGVPTAVLTRGDLSTSSRSSIDLTSQEAGSQSENEVDFSRFFD